MAEIPGPAAHPAGTDASTEKLSVAVTDEMSAEEIDKVLEEEDPEFLNQISQVSRDKELSLPNIEISSEDQALTDEQQIWSQGAKWRRLIYQAYPGVARLSLFVKKQKFKLIAFYQNCKVRLKNFLYFLWTTGRDKLTQAVKSRILSFKTKMGKTSERFRYMPVLGKLAVFGTLLLALATGGFVYLSLTRGIFHGETSLFVTSLENVADQSFAINDTEEREPFYDNLRMGNHLFLVPKMVVNLKRSSKSSDNPMGAFEFYVEGTNQDVLIEIKDREVELRDLMYRTLEGFNFEQADSPDGKELICEKLRKELNAVLSQGKIRKVWLKTAIVKP